MVQIVTRVKQCLDAILDLNCKAISCTYTDYISTSRYMKQAQMHADMTQKPKHIERPDSERTLEYLLLVLLMTRPSH